MSKKRPARITVQAHFEDKEAGISGELISEDIPIEVLPFESEVAEAEARLGVTMPTKVRFLMVRLDVGCVLPTYPEELPKAQAKAIEMTKKEFVKQVRELRKDIIPFLIKQIR